MNFKRIALCAVSLSLVAIACLSPIFSSAYSVGEGDFDYSRPGSSHNEQLNSADILERYLGGQISSWEYDYLAHHGGVTLSFDRGVNTSYSMLTYDEVTGILSVEAFVYSYIAENGTEVIWTPSSVTVGGDRLSFTETDDSYYAEFSGVSRDDSLRASIEYSLSFEISEKTINTLLGMAYADAPLKLAQRDRYNADAEAYEVYMERLSEYESNYALYTEYLTKKRIYDTALAEYNAYLDSKAEYDVQSREYEEYQRKLAEYNTAYAAYKQYLRDLDAYNNDCVEYEKFLSDMETVRYHIAILDMMSVRMTSLSRTLYNAVMGSTVDTVLQNKSVFTGPMVGADPAVIDAAGDSTERLRELMSAYAQLTDEESKYVFYTVNYEGFRDNYLLLLQALDELYQNNRVRTELNRRGAEEKYVILLSQLYLVSNALSDGRIYSYTGKYAFDSTYRFTTTYSNKKLTVKDVLEGVDYLPDLECASPLSEGYPEQLSEPQSPEEISEPQAPKTVQKPIEPTPVSDPGEAPATVDCPTKPDEVSHPGQAPDRLDLALAGALERGEITEREPNVGGFVLTETATVDRAVFNPPTVTVRFHGEDGTLLDVSVVERGDLVDYTGTPLTKDEDVAATYSFAGWVDAEGRAVDLTSASEDLNLYASFERIPKKFNVIFNVGTDTHPLYLEYGDTPAFPGGIPYIPEDTRYEYIFKGWDNEITEVTADAEYTAIFDKVHLVPYLEIEGVGASSVELIDGYYVIDGRNGFGVSYDISRFVNRSQETGALGVIIDMISGSVTIPSSSLAAMQKDGVGVVSVNTARALERGGYYEFSLHVSDGAESVGGQYPVSLSLFCHHEMSRRTRLSSIGEDGIKVYSSYSYADGIIGFDCVSNRTYTLCDEYSVNVIPSDTVTVETRFVGARPGDAVSFTCNVPTGIRLLEVYLVLSDGTEVAIDGDSFVMPEGDVSIGAVGEYIKYKVNFKNGGSIISSKTYKYGDTVTVPADPLRSSDGIYSYRFIGWSPVLSETVTGDAEYVAEYEAILLPPKEEQKGLIVSESVMRLIIAAAVCASVVILIVIPGTVITVVRLRSRKKKYKR